MTECCPDYLPVGEIPWISVPGALRYGIDGLPVSAVSKHKAQHTRAFLVSRQACKNESNGMNNSFTPEKGKSDKYI